MAATGKATMAPRMPPTANPMVMSSSTVAPLKEIMRPSNVGTRTEPSMLNAMK